MFNLIVIPRIQTVYWLFVYLTLFSCASSNHSANSQGILQRKTQFYDSKGKPTFTHYIKVWYKDSIAIEEITGVKTVTDTANITTVTYPLILCRYIDAHSRTVYDYESFSDTAKIFNKSMLPDSVMQDYGWNFLSEKAPKIQTTPELLSDTIVDNMAYKRAKFYFQWQDPKKSYLIGYFRCDRKGNLFSLEKEYSRSLNCTMVKYLEYGIGMVRPFASIEINYISDTLSKEELKVFDAWKKNARNNPVQK